MPDRTAEVGESLAVDVPGAFRVPDRDALTYASSSSSSSSSSPDVAAVPVAGSVVTVAPLSAGAARVTVTATDAGGSNRSAEQTFAVTVSRASPTAWTDDPIRPGVTPVKAVHFRELRARIDALRADAGLPANGWTDPELTPGVTPIESVHLTELPAALDAAYDAAGQPVPTWTGAAVTAGTVIEAVHLTALRAAVLELETRR